MHDSQWKKVLVFLFLGFIFFRTFFYWDLISWDFIGRKKSPRNPKHRILFPVTFFARTWENSDFFPGFFPRNFFPGTFLHRFFLPHWEISKTLFVSSKHQYGWTDRFQNILLELLWQQKRFRDDSMQSHQFIEKSPQNFV